MKARLSTSVLAFTLLVLSCQPAFAYLDPGTASMLLQGIIGGIAAGLTVITMKFQSLKLWIRSRFGKTDGTKQ